MVVSCGDYERLQAEIVACARCPRLRVYCQQVAQRKRAAYRDWAYWGKPVPNFGSPDARLLIVGLAPAAHGGNRTGRIFTGDASGDFLHDALYRVGFCNQPHSTHRGDGLQLHGVLITAAVHCAPPDNRPTREECGNCFPYLQRLYHLMPNLQGILALGQIAFDSCLKLLRLENQLLPGVRYTFQHGVIYPLQGERFLAASYHPSARNTYTGLLTKPMLIELLQQVRARLGLEMVSFRGVVEGIERPPAEQVQHSSEQG